MTTNDEAERAAAAAFGRIIPEATEADRAAAAAFGRKLPGHTMTPDEALTVVARSAFGSVSEAEAREARAVLQESATQPTTTPDQEAAQLLGELESLLVTRLGASDIGARAGREYHESCWARHRGTSLEAVELRILRSQVQKLRESVPLSAGTTPPEQQSGSMFFNEGGAR